jgi:hypothetical protein
MDLLYSTSIDKNIFTVFSEGDVVSLLVEGLKRLNTPLRPNPPPEVGISHKLSCEIGSFLIGGAIRLTLIDLEKNVNIKIVEQSNHYL